MVTAAYFDDWYADIDRSPTRRRIFTECLDLPPEVEPSNLVPLAGLTELASALDLSAGALLVDLACGRGGPGMWLARAAGARLVGVDFSGVAVAQATARRPLFGLEERARFVVGDLTATGLRSGIADAVLCIDAIQFTGEPGRAAAEMRRLLRPGGRVALTCWEAREPGDPGLPERLRTLDVAGSASAAGFLQLTRVEKPGWRETERLLWERAAATPAAGDPAIESMHEEAARVLPTFDRFDRVLVTGRAPL